MSKFYANFYIFFSAVETDNSNIHFSAYKYFIVCQILQTTTEVQVTAVVN